MESEQQSMSIADREPYCPLGEERRNLVSIIADTGASNKTASGVSAAVFNHAGLIQLPAACAAGRIQAYNGAEKRVKGCVVCLGRPLSTDCLGP